MGVFTGTARLNVNVFYINFIYLVKSNTSAPDKFRIISGGARKAWFGVPAAAEISLVAFVA